MEKKVTLTEAQVKAADDYPGAATDVADNEKVDKKLVKEQVSDENNNPRNQAD